MDPASLSELVPMVFNGHICNTKPEPVVHLSSSQLLDFARLKLIWAHSISFPSPCRIHFQPETDSVTVRSSLNNLMGLWPAAFWLNWFCKHVHYQGEQDHSYKPCAYFNLGLTNLMQLLQKKFSAWGCYSNLSAEFSRKMMCTWSICYELSFFGIQTPSATRQWCGMVSLFSKLFGGSIGTPQVLYSSCKNCISPGAETCSCFSDDLLNFIQLQLRPIKQLFGKLVYECNPFTGSFMVLSPVPFRSM